MFNKSLQDVVKGIRTNKHNLGPYISGVISEIKTELTANDDDTKAQAIEKLTYLQLEGYSMSWANFHIVECMSMPWFGHRHIGYLAASQSFTKDTDVILLTTHLFRKAFSPSSADYHVMYETGAAISCLANIANKDLSMALLKDIYGMLNSARPYTRKKACLVLYKLFQTWPKALRLSFPRLREKLNDTDPSVCSAAVYVVCELARNNPKNYLSLAPEFFKILTTSSNNWILIKIVKLLGSLVPLEPRLAKKLRDPLHDIITTTPAKSLLYECINTLISGKLTSKSVVSLCMEKLRTFIEDPDQNLKYLGLLGLHKLMKQHLRVVAEHKDLVLDCLEDEDPTIRRRAIDIITRMVSRKNMGGIVRRLLVHLKSQEGDYRNYVMSRIIQICSQENFAFISDFAWYVNTLLQLTVMLGTSHENSVALKGQFIDILVRVKGVRKYCVKHLTDLLRDKDAAMSGALTNTALSEVLFAAAWAVGEYPDLVKEPVELLKSILDPSITRLCPNTQVVYLHAAIKICAYVLKRLISESGEDEGFAPEGADGADIKTAGGGGAALADVMGLEETSENPSEDLENKIKDDDEDINIEIKTKEQGEEKSPKKRLQSEGGDWRIMAKDIMDTLMVKMMNFTRSNDVEVQERAVCYHRFIRALRNTSDSKEKTGEPEKLDLLSLTKGQAQSVIQQFVEFFGVSDAEKLSLVHPKAQKRVKIPAGLNLEKWINEPESDSDDDFDVKYDPDETFDSLDDFLDNNKKKKKKKGRKGKDSQDKEEKRRRAKAAKKNNPFYLAEEENKNADNVDVDDIPLSTLDFEVTGGKRKKGKRGRKKFKKKDSDDLPQRYEVAAGPILDGDDTDEDDNKAALDVDIHTPLQDDEVMPDASAYPKGTKGAGPQKTSKDKRSKKKDRKAKKEKKKKRSKGGKIDSEEPEDKKVKKKSSKGPAPTANILGFGDSPAIKPIEAKVEPVKPPVEDEYELEMPEVAEQASSKKKKKDKKGKKDKKKKRDKKKDRESKSESKSGGGSIMDILGAAASPSLAERKEEKSTSVPQGLFSSGEPGFRKKLLYKDNALCIYFTTRAEKHQPYSLFVDIYMVTVIKKLDIARIELSNSYEDSTECPNPSPAHFEASSLRRGKAKSKSLTLEWKTFDGPRIIPATVYYKLPGNEKMVRQMCEMKLGCSSFFLPMKISMDNLAMMIKGGGGAEKVFSHKKGGKVILKSGMSMKDAVKAIGATLNVHMVKAMSGRATYYGRSVRSPTHHMAVYIKGSSNNTLDIDIMTSHPFLAQALVDEASWSLATLPTIPS